MNLENIKARCDEVGDCWEWDGYYERSHPRSAGKSVRRIVYELTNGPLKPDKYKVVTMSCNNTKCVNPEHLVYVAKSVVTKRTGKLGLFSGLVRKQRIAEKRRAQSGKITMEIAREIRASTRSAKEEAQFRGVHHTLIYKVRANDSWREYGGNHFAGLMG